MFGGLFAIFMGALGIGKWAKEDAEEKERRFNSKTRYYADKHGNLRVTLTGKKATHEDFAADWRRMDYNNARRHYAIYVKSVDLRNYYAEKERYNVVTKEPIYTILGIKRHPIPFDEWRKRGGKGTSRYPDEIVKDDYFYMLSKSEQEIALMSDEEYCKKILKL